MKQTIFRFLSCVGVLAAMVLPGHATSSIHETFHYTICPGDTINKLTTHNLVVYSDTIVYDTIILATQPEPDTLINVYEVNVYPHFEMTESKRLAEGESMSWQGKTITAPGAYERIFHSMHGCDSIYRLNVRVEAERTFFLCDEETVTFHGRTYANEGTYYDDYTVDTVFKITIVKHPTQLHLQNGVLDKTNPYYWQYMLNGEAKTDTIYVPGVYEHTTHNTTTGCNDIWRLILTQDNATYHYVETLTICENEPFSWRGRADLNRSGIGTTTHYFDRYRTAADQDSIYELVLTVNPVQRTTQTVPFCGSIVWNGKTYTESTTIVDTLQSVRFHCDSIITTNLSKGHPVVFNDTVTITTGEVLQWHGQFIHTAGNYFDIRHSSFGCDSTYNLHVIEHIPAKPINTHSEWNTTCQGDGFAWRGDTYYNSGTYYDTIFKAGSTDIDSLYILYLTVHPTYSRTERITFLTFPQTYREQNIPGPGEYVFTYQSLYGCDSVITAYIDREVYRDEQTVVICPGDTHIWDVDGQTYNVSGTYTKVEQDKNGNDSVTHILNLTVRYIPETQAEETICKGATYVFGDRTLTESGVYRHTFHKTGGCDSTVVLSLNVLSPDTTYLAIQREQGTIYQWGTQTIYEPGMYFQYGTNRFGCDSVSILQYTYNQVDTIEEHLTACPNELPFVWNGIEANQTNHYGKVVQQPGGNYIYYSLYLTVRDVVTVDTTFTICDDASLNFNGKTYTEGGLYRDWLSCDTLMNIHIVKHPQQVYETNAKLGGDGYTWTYMENGTEKTQTFTAAGTYEFESPNPTTGCSEIWRLILTKDETTYHFVETLTVCEGEDFTWRGLTNLSQQGVGETSHYFDNYKSRAGQDSIYELVLTVTPIERTVRTIVFCNETEWKGVTYTTSTVVYDTIATANGCYRFERINFDKQTPFYYSETKELPQGTVLHWHGQNITTDGTYYDYNTTVHGCDSIYQITVTIIPAAPETNQYAEELSTCEGDTILWRGRDIWRSGTYVDTVYKAGTQNIDSIFTLHFTAWPAPKDTIYQHLYTCGAGASIRYQGQDYYTDQEVVANLKTIHGCDSIVKVFLHFNTALFLSDTVEIADTQLPYTWNYRLSDVSTDTVLTADGTYNHITPAEGSCTNKEQLVLIVYPTYLFEQDTTICELDLPFFWQRGPIEHQSDPLQHAIGTTKQYEYRYTTVNNTDSIYRLHLTIDEAPKRIEQVFFCEGEKIQIGSKIYVNLVSDSVYRDTVTHTNPGSICDSIIYYEIYQYPKQQLIETQVIHEGETIHWRGETITAVQTKTYTQDSIDEVTGCHVINQLRVIAEMRDERVICSNDTAADVHPDKRYPFIWEHPYAADPDTLYSTGIWTDTVYNAEGSIEHLYTMDLTIVNPYDTTIYVHGCENKGAVWRDRIYETDTTFVERVEVNPYDPKAPCDSVFHVHIVIDTIYNIRIDTTLCEYQLPFIVGRVNPDTIWWEGDFRHESDSTVCGCDSIIEGHLTIIPKLDRNDSTFVCEDYLNAGGVVTLGDTVHPAFLENDGGKWAGKWEGKWTGVHYSQDTIVWDCNHTYFHHIIMRPSQKFPKDTTYYLCEGDSVQLFWPKTQWIKKDTVYFDTVPMGYQWTDPQHGTSYYDQLYLCDSVTRWTVKFVHPEFKDTTAHRQLGDSIWWGGEWRYYTGSYDSIGVAREKNSDSIPCRLTYTLHLIMDTAYYYRDTVDVCAYPNRTLNHTWFDGHVQSYTVGTTDTEARHYFDSLVTVQRRDSIYDLCVNYRIVPTVHLYDTICEGTSLRWDIHHRDNSVTERYLTTAGIYYDTIPGTNVCDSVLIMHLYMRDRVPVTYNSVTVSDRELPYLWYHTWIHNGADTTAVDTLRSSGEYTFPMTNIFGCDSIDSLSFRVHQTHVFRDTTDICAPINTTLTHVWSTGYHQDYTTPLMDDSVLYADTLETRVLFDSIYVLCVNYHRTYETLVRDTICEGERYRFDLHQGNNTIERWFDQAGTYLDTIESRFGCDSVIMLKLYVRDRVPVTHNTVHIPDTAAPYPWYHRWIENGQPTDSTQMLSATGEYEFRMPNIYGCDSIDSLHLFIHPTYRIQEDSLTICYDQTPYTWQDRNDITATCDLEFHALTMDGYDSIRYVHIEVLPIMHTVLHDTICEGDSLRFGLTKMNQPRFLTNIGVYYDTLTSVQHGCDSIIEMRLNVYPRFIKHHRVDIADTEWPYVWYHIQRGDTIGADTLYDSGEYTFTLHSIHGCDSIDSLSLYVHPTYRIREDDIVICADQTPYTWQGRDDITHSCDLTFYGLTQDGYDSIRYVHIEVLPILHTLRYDSICHGQSYRFGLTKDNHPRNLTQSGVYFDTLTSIQYGCDSIIELRLNVFPTYTHHQYVDIADTEAPYLWYHIQGNDTVATDTLYTPGIHKYIFQTAHGCDSTDNCTLRIHKTYVFRDTVTICQSETPYTWENIQDIYETGEYIRHLQTYDHYDSTLIRYVNVIPEPKVTIRHSICTGDSYLFKGQMLTESGVYSDTVKATLGCDSITTLILTVNQPVFNTRVEHIIEGNSVLFYDSLYTEAGTYTHFAKTPEGCDSTSVLQLIVHPLVDTTVTVCSTELPYLWVNKWTGYITPLYEAGIYRNDTSIVNGEKMFYGLQLIVNEPTSSTIYREICEEDIYNFNGKFLTTSGQYRDTIRNSHGCDSVVILNLNVLKKYYNSIDRTIYEGDTVMFQGQSYGTAGIYPVRLTSSFGCDSIIELRLTVNRLFDDSVTVCANELPLVWRGKNIFESGIYRDTTINADGKISSIGLKVNVLPIAHLEQPIVASICEGDVYQFGTRMLTIQGTYYDTLTAANGCDSIVMLSLQVHPVNFQTEYKRIFEGDSAFFDGVWYKESGIYEKRTTNANNCTDTYQFVLTVLKSSNVDTVAVVCQNDLPFIWRGLEYNETGEYKLPISWTDSSRVTMTLHLTVNKTFYGERNISICAGDTIRYNGKYYSENGEFIDTIASTAGCDSIIKYIVSVHPTYDKVFEKHISDKEPYIFHDRVLTQSGTFEWTGKSMFGCDSLEHLKLTVHPSFFQSDTIDLCQSDSLNYPYVWKDEDGRLIATITQSGIYRDSVLTAYGFDSVHQVVVNIHPMYMTKEQYEIGTGEVLKIHGRDISSPAVYYDTLRTIHGCDSIFHVVVNPKRTREFTWTKEICQGDYYDFFGKHLMSGGLYTYTSQYKDSIVYLHLTVQPTSLTKKDIVITAEDLPYAYQGQFYEAGGIYTENLKNHNGCDSIVRLNIIITEHYSEWNQIPLCSGSQLIIDKDTIRSAGQYVFLRRSKVTNKMDSLYRVEVYDAPSYEMPAETRSICSGDTVLFAGKQFYKNGVHQVKLKSVDGCDSIVTLNLTVWPAFKMDTVVKIMDDEVPFHWEGRDYYNSGDYDRSWQIGDCDSTRTLHLTVVESIYDTLTTTICDGQVFKWRGKIYDTDGFYVDSIVDRVNKYKAYYTLRLIVAYPTLLTSARASDYKEGDDDIEITFTYNGLRPTSYSILFDNHAKQEGFVDIYDAPIYTDGIATLPIPQPTGTCYDGKPNYIRPDRYTMRLMLDNGVCGQSKSDSMEFIIKYPSWIIEQNWDDVVAPLKAECNCGYEFSTIEWFWNGQSVIAPYLHEDRMRAGDEVYAKLTRKGENYAVPTHTLIIQPVTGPYNEYPIIVNPTQAPRHAPIVMITAQTGGTYEIYAATGQIVHRGAFETGDTQVTLPAINGIYFIRTHQGDETETHKVLIY